MIKRWLVSFAYWLLRICGETAPTPIWQAWPLLPSDLVIRAAWLVEQQARESTEMDSGEVRRHRVYARLVKDFPQTPRRYLALAIEQAVMALPR